MSVGFSGSILQSCVTFIDLQEIDVHNIIHIHNSLTWN